MYIIILYSTNNSKICLVIFNIRKKRLFHLGYWVLYQCITQISILGTQYRYLWCITDYDRKLNALM